MALALIITNDGRAALVNAAHDGTAPVRIATVGISQTAFVATPAATALPNEIKRIATISGDVVAADTIHLIVRDEGDDQYPLRAFGLYLADGTLFACYGQSATIVEKSSQSLLLLAIDVRFTDIAASEVSFGNANFLNPPATVDRLGVVQLASAADAIAGTNDLKAVTPGAVRAAYRDVWRASNDGSGSGLDADLLDGRHADDFLRNSPTDQTSPITIRNASPRLILRDTLRRGAVLNAEGGVLRIWRTDNNDSPTIANLDNGYQPFQMALDTGLTRFGGDVYVRGAIVWTLDNDGAGSGLDADLLDGQQGAWFADIPARLGFTPANRAGQIFGGRIGRDTGFALDMAGTAPALFFADDAGGADRLEYDRATNNWSFSIAGSSAVQISQTRALFNGAVQVAGAISRAGNPVWDAGTDGSGSGLDADLLDGQHGAWFADIPARLGFTPVRLGGGAGQLANIVRIGWAGSRLKAQVDSDDLGNIVFDAQIADVWRAGNDGSGSGLDADLLDGQHGSWFTDIPARLGYTPVRIGGGAGQLANFVRIGWAGTRLKAQVDDNDLGNIVFDAQIADVWRAANDGSGSGLDADLLDGRHAADFALLSGWQSANGDTGWRIEPDGRIMQWGKAVVSDASGITDVVFPREFRTACYTASANNISDGIPSAWASVGNWSKTGMRIGHAKASLQPAAAGTAAAWQAWGR